MKPDAIVTAMRTSYPVNTGVFMCDGMKAVPIGTAREIFKTLLLSHPQDEIPSPFGSQTMTEFRSHP